MTHVFQQDAPKHSPLHSVHEQLGAQFTNFGGFEMPVRYDSDLKEHQAVREAAGLFDVSHMGKVFVSGPGAAALLDYALAGLISTQPVGSAKYTLILNEAGGIIDDLLSYRLGEESFLLIPNAGNQDEVFAELLARQQAFSSDAGSTDVNSTDASAVVIENGAEQWGVLALQGPKAEEILLAAGAGIALPETLPKYYRFVESRINGFRLLIARTGYTGEDGFEFVVETGGLEALWQVLMQFGAPVGMVAAGLAARDSLRLEAGFPLYGNELGVDVKPAEAGLGRIVAMSKDNFVGKAALVADAGSRTLIALEGEGRRAVRSGYSVLTEASAESVGVITSGALSPTLGHPIAFALVEAAPNSEDSTFAVGAIVQVDLRGKPQDYRVITSPFYTRPQA